jgi:hypothetical protein
VIDERLAIGSPSQTRRPGFYETTGRPMTQGNMLHAGAEESPGGLFVRMKKGDRVGENDNVL